MGLEGSPIAELPQGKEYQKNLIAYDLREL